MAGKDGIRGKTVQFMTNEAINGPPARFPERRRRKRIHRQLGPKQTLKTKANILDRLDPALWNNEQVIQEICYRQTIWCQDNARSTSRTDTLHMETALRSAATDGNDLLSEKIWRTDSVMQLLDGCRRLYPFALGIERLRERSDTMKAERAKIIQVAPKRKYNIILYYNNLREPD